MSMKASKHRRLAGIGTILSLVTCYDTLALVSILGALGFAIAINNAIWAGAIVAFAIIAVIGLAFGLSRHHKPIPFIIGILGTDLIIYTMLSEYSLMIELSGFALLILAAFLDRRIKRKS
jgi:hypothetical protein